MAFLDSTIGIVFVTLAAVLAFTFVWNSVKGYIRDMNAPNQVVMFKHPTDVVPAAVVKTASRARWSLWGWYLLFGVVIYAVIYSKSPDAAEAIWEWLMSLVMLLLDVAIAILDGVQQLLAELV